MGENTGMTWGVYRAILRLRLSGITTTATTMTNFVCYGVIQLRIPQQLNARLRAQLISMRQ